MAEEWVQWEWRKVAVGERQKFRGREKGEGWRGCKGGEEEEEEEEEGMVWGRGG